MSPGTEHTAIWPLGFRFLYTIVSSARASLQDFAGFVPSGADCRPRPLLASSLLPLLRGLGVLLSLRVRQGRNPKVLDQVQVPFDQAEGVAGGLCNFLL